MVFRNDEPRVLLHLRLRNPLDERHQLLLPRGAIQLFNVGKADLPNPPGLLSFRRSPGEILARQRRAVPALSAYRECGSRPGDASANPLRLPFRVARPHTHLGKPLRILFRNLVVGDEDAPSASVVRHVQKIHGMKRGAGTGKEVQHNRVLPVSDNRGKAVPHRVNRLRELEDSSLCQQIVQQGRTVRARIVTCIPPHGLRFRDRVLAIPYVERPGIAFAVVSSENHPAIFDELLHCLGGEPPTPVVPLVIDRPDWPQATLSTE